MFEETEFDDDDDTCDKPMKRRRLETNPADVKENTAVSFKRLHRPGDAHFSLVAGCTVQPEQQKGRAASSNTKHSGARDQKHSSGDQWVSSECHCIQCEVIRVSAHSLASLPADTIVVLLDLDNFGFHQFKKKPPRFELTTGERKRLKRKVKSSNSNKDEPHLLPVSQLSASVPEHVFVWAFYGSCFGRHYGCLPEEGLADAVDGSIWQQLQSSNRVHFTPCGGHDQAVDEVLVAISAALTHRKHIAVTRDRHLAETIGSGTGTNVLGVIDVNDCDRQLVMVWKQLALMVLYSN